MGSWIVFNNLIKEKMAKRYLYRGDSRTPEEIFNSGFEPKHTGGIQIQKGGQMFGGVSTTYNLAVALKYAALYSGFVYLIHTEGTDMLKQEINKKESTQNKLYSLLGLKTAAPKTGVINNLISQAEIACARPPIDILCARKAIVNNGFYEFSGPVITNNNIPETLINHHNEFFEFKLLDTLDPLATF
ncbi:hypothetical protein [Chromobacterium amazonense]|uniref:hypothetical protein n=1 Tax=Chromobacterium amazonense TaxID=1382803 RepID=UPI0031F704EC